MRVRKSRVRKIIVCETFLSDSNVRKNFIDHEGIEIYRNIVANDRFIKIQIKSIKYYYSLTDK